MKPYLSEEEYKAYEHAVATNKTGIDHLNDNIFQHMYGYSSHEEYYKSCGLNGRLSNISVPTFALHALDDAMCGEF